MTSDTSVASVVPQGARGLSSTADLVLGTSSTTHSDAGPDSIDAIRAARSAIDRWIDATPLWRWQIPKPGEPAPWLKLELFQRAGSFKPRGALTVMGSLDADALARGVTAISAGNHAMAVGTSAKVVMPRNYVDELVLVDDDQLREAMRLLFCHAKLAVEPAGAASTAALLGPLRERLAGKQVAAIVCGSNIDERSFAQLLDQRGPTTDALADPCARQS